MWGSVLCTYKSVLRHQTINPNITLLQFYRVLTCFEPAGGRKLLDWKWSPTSGKWERSATTGRWPSPWLTEVKLIDTKLHLRLVMVHVQYWLLIFGNWGEVWCFLRGPNSEVWLFLPLKEQRYDDQLLCKRHFSETILRWWAWWLDCWPSSMFLI